MLSPSSAKVAKKATSTTPSVKARSAIKAQAVVEQEDRVTARVDKVLTTTPKSKPSKSPVAAESTAKKPAAAPKDDAAVVAPSSVRRRRSVAPSTAKDEPSAKKSPAKAKAEVVAPKTSAYAQIVESYPLMANGVQAAVINAAGVLTAQIIKANGIPSAFDWADVAIFMVIGAFVITPLILLVLIGRIFQLGLPKGKLLVANTLFGMFLVNAVFHVCFGVLYQLLGTNGQGLAGVNMVEICAGIFTREFMNGAIQSRIVFFPADAANTFFVPQLYQPLVSNFAGFLYTILLALRFTP